MFHHPCFSDQVIKLRDMLFDGSVCSPDTSQSSKAVASMPPGHCLGALKKIFTKGCLSRGENASVRRTLSKTKHIGLLYECFAIVSANAVVF